MSVESVPYSTLHTISKINCDNTSGTSTQHQSLRNGESNSETRAGNRSTRTRPGLISQRFYCTIILLIFSSWEVSEEEPVSYYEIMKFIMQGFDKEWYDFK
jgi:hypothetical protein